MASQGAARSRAGIATEATERRIPPFGSVEEEAAFWDTHDSADYEDEFSPVDDIGFLPTRTSAGKRGLTVRFDEETLAELTRIAREMGIGPSTLIRMWVLERLRSGSR